MRKPLSVILVVVAFFVIAFAVEAIRGDAVRAWASTHGFVEHAPFTPGDNPPVEALARRFQPNGPLRFGRALEGELGGVRVWIVEHQARVGSKRDEWHTLVTWRVLTPPGPPERTSSWPHGTLLRDGDWAAWRLAQLPNAERLELIRAELPAARRLVEQDGAPLSVEAPGPSPAP